MAKTSQPAASVRKAKDDTIREAIDTLRSQGREITTAAILWMMRSIGRPDIWASDIYASPAWKEAVAKQKGTAEIPLYQ